MNDKKLYLASMGFIMVCALIACVLGVFGKYGFAIAFLALAIASLPALGHLRMRRTLSAMRQLRFGGHNAAPAISNAQLQSVEQRMLAIQDDLREVRTIQDAQSNIQELAQFSADIRREARMARVLNETTRQELARSNNGTL